MSFTLRELKRFVDDQLGSILDDRAQQVAERNLLLRHFLSISPETLLAYPEKCVPYNQALDQLLEALYLRVENRTPLQYLLHHAAFYGLTFQVSPNTLIPRPETEVLVDHALAFLQNKPNAGVLDLGTGSGCIAIAIKHHAPWVHVTAVDLYQKALDVAQSNAQALQVSITFLQGSWFMPVPSNCQFNLIVSNPPYIAQADAATLTPEVLQEPHSALFSPEEPLRLIESLLFEAKGYLAPGGQMLIELGAGQGPEAVQIAQVLGYSASLISDYAGHQRFLSANSP